MRKDTLSAEYPQRKYGMDHPRYAWSMLADRPRVSWTNGSTLAVWVNVSLEHFPMNPIGSPVKLPGSMTMPYPDLRHYTLRDYGNRVGIYRMLGALDKFGIRPSFAINAALIQRYPYLAQFIRARGNEILGHSWSMDTPHVGGLSLEDETECVRRTLSALRRFFDNPIRGWLSPGKLQSPNTPEVLKLAGIDYFCDWVNDELPYQFQTDHGAIWSLPLTTEIEDRFVIMDNLHAEAAWAEQVCDAFDFLLAESRHIGGRLLSLSLHPWVIGQPHRIKHLETVLRHITGQSGVWQVEPSQILDAFVSQSDV